MSAGTVYELERDRATGNDPDSLRHEIERYKAGLRVIAGYLGENRPADASFVCEALLTAEITQERKDE